MTKKVGWLDFGNLSEVPFNRLRFTWAGVRARHVIKTCLDRCVATKTWSDFYSASCVCHLKPNKFDHVPILLEIRKERRALHKGKKRFRFNENWGMEEGCEEVIRRTSSEAVVVPDAFSSLCIKIKRTRAKEIELIKSKMADFYYPNSLISADSHRQMEEQLSELLHYEMMYWRQRAKAFWLQDGDANTKFFHRTSSMRKQINAINGLFNSDGVWCQKEADIQNIVTSYFRDLFSSSGVGDTCDNWGLFNPIISAAQNEAFICNISKDEVYVALNQMHPNKSPSPDGFSPSFFQKFWDVVGDEVVASIRCFLSSDDMMRKVNDTLIVLIQKVANLEYMQQLRPISLCNFIYKIGSKVLANRLKTLMDSIISPQQGVFVPGRLITDNSIIAYEIAHNMKQQRHEVGYCELNLETSKAYDRFEWKFLEKTM